MCLFVAVDEARLAVELDLFGCAGLGERLSEEVALAGDFEEGWLDLLEGCDDELVDRHQAAQHDVACAEIGLEGLEVDSAHVAIGVSVACVLEEDTGESALQGRVDDDGAGFGFIPPAVHTFCMRSRTSSSVSSPAL